jgi:cytochrome c-type biogenesis protein
MTGGPGFQVAIGRALSHLLRRVEAWTAPVPEPVLGLALLALAAVFAVAALRDRRRPDPAGQPPVPSDPGTPTASPDPGHGAADHHSHAPVRNQS